MTEPCPHIVQITETATSIKFLLDDTDEIKKEVKGHGNYLASIDKKIEGMRGWASGAGAVAGLTAGIVIQIGLKIFGAVLAMAATVIK